MRPQVLGRFIDAAHAAGMRVVAWYLPSFLYPAQDTRRALAAIRFRSAKGERFDSFALDIEASLVSSVPLRSKRLLSSPPGCGRPSAAATRSARSSPRRSGSAGIRTYWPRFPYRPLAHYYDVFLPMAYATDRHIRGVRATRAYNAADVAIIRDRTGKPHVPIHLIGGLSQRDGPEGDRGLHARRRRLLAARLQPVRVLGHETGDLEALAAPPAGGGRACT